LNANVSIQPRKSLRFRGRSFMALVFAPEPPLEDWLAELDAWSAKSPGYFVGRPIILDVSALPLDKAGLAALIAALSDRAIRIMGVEGTKASWLGLGMPPLVGSGRQTSTSELAEAELPPAAPAASPAARTTAATPANGKAKEATPAAQPAGLLDAQKPQAAAAALVHDSPVRSGQSIIYPQGDVTVIGHIASGAEVIAGGSIHVYGALRGRAIAGSVGNPNARIFCGKLEAELLAIDGLYRTADEMEPEFRGRPVQAWLDGDAMAMAALN
jgi:septum site-determining protein MinC